MWCRDDRDATAAAAVFLVLPSLWIGDRAHDRVRVRDDVDLPTALNFSDPCLLLIQFNSIRFDSVYEDITKQRDDHDDGHNVDDMLIV